MNWMNKPMALPRRHPLSNVPSNHMRHAEPLGDSHSKIHIKPSHKGLLHEKLGVPEDEPIPESKLEAAKHSKSPAERKEANFALNFGHKK